MNRLVALVWALVAAAAVAVLAGVHLGTAAAAGPFTVTVIGTSPYAFQDSNGNAPAHLAVPLGASVTFSNPGGGFHDVDFDSIAPSACSGSTSVNSTNASVGPWQGSCTFTSAGTYSFHCSIHGFTGQIVVDASSGGGTGATGATGSTGAGAGGGAGGSGPTGSSGAPPPLGGTPTPSSGQPGTTPAAGQGLPITTATGTGATPKATIAALTVPAVSHGFSVSATAQLGRGRSTLRASLRLGRSQALGSLTQRRVGPGRVSFTVMLDAHGRRLLRARRVLEVVLVVTVTTPDGSRATRTRMLKLRV